MHTVIQLMREAAIARSTDTLIALLKRGSDEQSIRSEIRSCVFNSCDFLAKFVSDDTHSDHQVKELVLTLSQGIAPSETVRKAIFAQISANDELDEKLRALSAKYTLARVSAVASDSDQTPQDIRGWEILLTDATIRVVNAYVDAHKQDLRNHEEFYLVEYEGEIPIDALVSARRELRGWSIKPAAPPN
jgi:hypothetical protein